MDKDRCSRLSEGPNSHREGIDHGRQRLLSIEVAERGEERSVFLPSHCVCARRSNLKRPLYLKDLSHAGGTNITQADILTDGGSPGEAAKV